MLTVVHGPMFAGKTTWLFNYVQGLPVESCMVFKPGMDTRFAEDACVTHDGKRVAAANLDVNLPRFPKLADTVQTILIDELNFFDPDSLIPAIRELQKQGRSVAAVGLMHDFMKRPFGATQPLTKIADKVVQLYAICDGCGKKAKHSYRKLNSKKQVVLGAEDAYGACCSSCWRTLSAAVI